MYNYKAKLIRIIDGDTIEVEIDLGFNIRINQIVRIYGIDAPELKSSDPVERKYATRAMEKLRELLLDRDLFINIIKQKDKYGRYLADITVGIYVVSQFLVDEKLVWAYFGDQKIKNFSKLRSL